MFTADNQMLFQHNKTIKVNFTFQFKNVGLMFKRDGVYKVHPFKQMGVPKALGIDILNG